MYVLDYIKPLITEVNDVQTIPSKFVKKCAIGYHTVLAAIANNPFDIQSFKITNVLNYQKAFQIFKTTIIERSPLSVNIFLQSKKPFSNRERNFV